MWGCMRYLFRISLLPAVDDCQLSCVKKSLNREAEHCTAVNGTNSKTYLSHLKEEESLFACRLSTHIAFNIVKVVPCIQPIWRGHWAWVNPRNRGPSLPTPYLIFGQWYWWELYNALLPLLSWEWLRKNDCIVVTSQPPITYMKYIYMIMAGTPGY